MQRKIYLLILSSFFFIQNINSQLFIDNSYTVEEMVMDFFSNSCVTPSNITFSGGVESIAFFDAGNTNLSVQAGIIISTGDVFDAIGPNTSGGTGSVTGSTGDPDLEGLIGAITNDAAIIEMDIVSTGDVLEFSYVFASEEYPEYAGSAFNDGFAFFISGPGISGLQNIAMIPGTTQAVSINNVNAISNSNFYVDNAGGQEIEFDAYTTEMIATANVSPNETYQVKIVIADASDAIFDSGIFLGVESLCGDSLLSPITSTNLIVDDQNLTVQAENGTKYATTHFWDFGDGMTSTEKTPPPHIYASGGTYQVTLISSNYCCSDTTVTEIEVGIVDNVEDLNTANFKVNPNPISDNFEINFDKNGKYEIRIFDMMGQRIFSRIGEGNTSVDFSNASNGMYLLEIIYEGDKYVEKLIKH